MKVLQWIWRLYDRATSRLLDYATDYSTPRIPASIARVLCIRLPDWTTYPHKHDGEGCGLCYEDGCSYRACLCDAHKDSDTSPYITLSDVC